MEYPSSSRHQKENCEHFYVIKFDNLNEVDHSLKYVVYRNWEKKYKFIITHYLSESNSYIKNLTWKKRLAQRVSLVIQIFKK